MKKEISLIKKINTKLNLANSFEKYTINTKLTAENKTKSNRLDSFKYTPK
ncbi:hypothetical protein GCM10007203_18230 [Staphylococcus nepalensis]|nr:hypothetical protein GCM10007203_18230 [Staphylococcus nepalensis]